MCLRHSPSKVTLSELKFSLDNMLYTTYHKSEGGSSLDAKMQAKVFRTIDLLENNGTDLRAPYSSPLNDGIFELRIKQGSNITRVLYFFFIGNKAILTNGFIKKTQKTPTGQMNYYQELVLRKQNIVQSEDQSCSR